LKVTQKKYLPVDRIFKFTDVKLIFGSLIRKIFNPFFNTIAWYWRMSEGSLWISASWTILAISVWKSLEFTWPVWNRKKNIWKRQTPTKLIIIVESLSKVLMDEIKTTRLLYPFVYQNFRFCVLNRDKLQSEIFLSVKFDHSGVVIGLSENNDFIWFLHTDKISSYSTKRIIVF